MFCFSGELAVHDQRPPDGDLIHFLPGDSDPHALLVVQLHHNHLLLTPYVGPSGCAWLVDTAADVVQQDAEGIHQGHHGTDGQNGGQKEAKEGNKNL